MNDQCGEVPDARVLKEVHYLSTPDGARMAAAWVYDRSCPTAVLLHICAQGRVVTWTIDRGLLRDGLHCTRLRPAGLGDVVLHTAHAPRRVLVVDLRVPEAHVRLLLDWWIATQFLRRTYWAVPEEREAVLLADQVDAAITACLDMGAS